MTMNMNTTAPAGMTMNMNTAAPAGTITKNTANPTAPAVTTPSPRVPVTTGEWANFSLLWGAVC